MRRVVVGLSGGVTSARCLGIALDKYPRSEVVALFHDTKSEHPDTYRFLKQIVEKFGVELTDRSDGRSVEQLERDEGAIANNQMAFCSRILKVEQRNRYFKELRQQGIEDITLVLGFTGHEWRRVQNHTMLAEKGGYKVWFPLKERRLSKQDCADWCISLGACPSVMYAYSDHANCVGCRRGGKDYWLSIKENEPQTFERIRLHEIEMGATVMNGTSLSDLVQIDSSRFNASNRVMNLFGKSVRHPSAHQKESIYVGACECGD